MRKSIVIAVLSLFAVGAAQVETAANHLKAGLWETSTQKMEVDGKDMLPQMAAAQKQMRDAIAKMPPEQRKQMDALLAGQSEDPMKQRMCVSAAMAQNDQPMLPKPRDAECSKPKMDRKGDRTAFDFSCKQADGSTMTGKGEIVNTGDLISTVINTSSVAKGGAKRTMTAITQMKFLGTDCGPIKPLDQLAKEMQASQAAQASTTRKSGAKADAAGKGAASGK